MDTERRPTFFEDGKGPHVYSNRRPKQNAILTNSTAQHNTTTKNILAQMKNSTLIGCDIIVN